tara:strand:+ start:7058 stop:7603 length:546 start_codon:yes stop_codon:yes gene_type:complete
MKKFIRIALISACFIFTANLSAQKFSSLDQSPMDAASYPSSYKVADKLAKVTYSRPQLKGRSVSELAPAGSVWRTGANESVEITFYKDATFGGTSVKAGTYSLFTIPGEKEWTVILNKNLNQWGAYTYDEAADLLRVKGTVSTGKESLESLSMTFNEGSAGPELVMGWGTVIVTVPVSEKK